MFGKDLARVIRIAMHLLGEAGQIGEFQLVAQLGDELDFDMAPVEVAGEVEQVRFQQRLHAYTITHAIEDQNVLRFHIDFFKPEGKNPPRPGEAIAKKAVIEAILIDPLLENLTGAAS